MTLDRLLKAATSHVETVRVSRTGINPLLWIVGLVTPAALVLSAFTKSPQFAAALFAFAAVPPIVAMIAYFVLLARRPEMLESEEYRLKRHALLMAYERGASAEIIEATSQVVRLESGTGAVDDEERP